MPKLTNLKGSEVLPKQINKVPGKECKCEAWGYLECGCGADWTDYTTHNQCVQSLDKIGVVGRLDRKELINCIWESMKIENDFFVAEEIADAIIQHQSSLIELELIDLSSRQER